MKFESKTTDKDLGYKRILKEIKNLDNARADIGYFGEKKEHGSDLSIVGIATVQEFGSPKKNIPARPFIRTTADQKKVEWRNRLDRYMADVLRGKTNVLSALTAFGEIAVSDIRKKITDIKTPPKSPSTIKREGEGFTNPLIWLGWMRNYARARIVINNTVKKVTREG